MRTAALPQCALMPRIARGEDQRLHLALPPGHRVSQQAQVAEVQLALGPRLAVGDPHRRCGPPEPAPLHAEPDDPPPGSPGRPRLVRGHAG
jgi:hypothetical protein